MSTCRVLLTGEGKHDLGTATYAAPEPKRWSPGDGGFLPPMLKRIAGDAGVPVEVHGHKYAFLPKSQNLGMTAAIEKKARGAMAIAVLHEMNAVVFHQDVDSDRRRGRNDILDAIERGASSHLGALPTIAAVPLHTVEAWALGADDAHRHLADLARPRERESPPQHPEVLWGSPREPAGNHPKQALRRCLGRDAHRGDFETLAEHTEIDHLSKRCPKSFAPFVEACVAALERCTAAEDAPRSSRTKPRRRRSR